MVSKSSTPFVVACKSRSEDVRSAPLKPSPAAPANVSSRAIVEERLSSRLSSLSRTSRTASITMHAAAQIAAERMPASMSLIAVLGLAPITITAAFLFLF